MILGLIVTIFSMLGIYGYFTSNLTLLYIGFGFAIFEHLFRNIFWATKRIYHNMVSIISKFVANSIWCKLVAGNCYMFML